MGCPIKACPHRFPKRDTLYPETGYFVAVSGDFIVGNGKFVSRNRWLCCQKRQQNILLPDTKLPLPSGYKVSCFRNQCGQALTSTDQKTSASEFSTWFAQHFR